MKGIQSSFENGVYKCDCDRLDGWYNTLVSNRELVLILLDDLLVVFDADGKDSLL